MWKIWDSCRLAAIFGLPCLCRVGSFFLFFSEKTFYLHPLKTNMEPQNEGLEDDFPFQRSDFQVPC